MVSPSTSTTTATKKQDILAPSNGLNKSQCKLQKGPKPLNGLKFYLEINKSHITSTRIETIIKQLGGKIELFLVRDVNYVFTDVDDCQTRKLSCGTPKSASVESLNATTNESPSQNRSPGGGKSKPKTRADAMLESVRRHTVVTSVQSPLENAREWGIHIWNVEKALNWLNKVEKSVKYTLEEKNKKTVKVSQIESPYIKFETFKRDSRPVFQTLHSWPQIRLGGKSGASAFSCARMPASEQIMTRKSRARTALESPIQPGYCELCRIEYSHLAQHLRSESHCNFVRNDGNFLALDSLIKGSNANVDNFLHLNGSRIKVDCSTEPKDYCPPKTRNRMPRLRAGSVCEKVKGISPLSPTGSESGRRLRSSHACVEETKKENHNHEQQSDTWESGRPKRTCIKNKRISADERLVVDNKSYYKVEVMTAKLRSSGLPLPNETTRTIGKLQSPLREETHHNNSTGTATAVDDPSLVVKFKRVRKSELSVLSDEAENFMFPKREDASDDDLSTDGGPNTTVSRNDTTNKHSYSSDLNSSPGSAAGNNTTCHDTIKSEMEICDEELSLDSCGSDMGKRRRRRTQAEAFISDNQKYYKFETPGSRLRYHGASLFIHNDHHSSTPITAAAGKNNGDCVNVKTEQEADKDDGYKPLNLDELEFSFERVPESEPWYVTYRRQDEGKEYYTCFSDSGYWKPLLLPYQIGPLPALDPKICKQAIRQIAEVASCSTPHDSANVSEEEVANVSSEESPAHSTLVKKRGRGRRPGRPPNSVRETGEVFVRRGSCRASKMLNNSPNALTTTSTGKLQRKSPRQHASTLAIMSLLHHRRRRDGKGRIPKIVTPIKEAPGIVEASSPLPTILEERAISEEPAASEPDYEQIYREMDNMLNEKMDNLDQLDLPIDPDLRLLSRSDAIELLNQYDNSQESEAENESCIGASPANSVISNSTGRLKARKRKKNLTGWPKRNNRRLFRSKNLKNDLPLDSNKLANSQPAVGDSEDSMDVDAKSGADNAAVINSNVVNSEHQKCNNNSSSVLKIMHRTSSSECSNGGVEEVQAAAANEARNSVNVDLEKWENAEKALSSGGNVDDHQLQTDLQYQPIVRVQKIDSNEVGTRMSKRPRSSSISPPGRLRMKKPKRSHPASPRSPRNLRRPRGRWYRER